jgi:hypothetical protein
VEAIGRNSNLGHLCKYWAELRKRVNESPARSPLSPRTDPKPRLKRFLNAQDVTDIAARYEAGETTQQVGNRYGISKSRVATILREHGITIRRQGLNDEHVREAATLYVAGRSLAWLGARYGISHATVAAALRRQGMQLRPRRRDVPSVRGRFVCFLWNPHVVEAAHADAGTSVLMSSPWRSFNVSDTSK